MLVSLLWWTYDDGLGGSVGGLVLGVALTVIIVIDIIH